MRSATLLGWGVLALAWASGTVVAGQEIPRGEYLLHVPLSPPRLIQQTTASVELHLFGDLSAPDYRDVEPRDGIDDRRNRVLLDLALRFAPYYVQNTDNIPTNFQTFVDNRDVFPLWIDTWDIGGVSPELVETRGVNFSVLGQAECDPSERGRAFEISPLPTTDPALEDCKVLELMERFTPGSGLEMSRDETLVADRPNHFPVVFFNMPGEGEGTWDGVYEEEYRRTPEARRASFPHSFVHPFIDEVVDDGGDPVGYELVLQYWVYYPTNDSGMNHEGDWEHVNVIVSPVSQVERPLSAESVLQILVGSLPATDEAADPLVIKRIDFYLHHLVMPLDFASPNVYRPHEEWEAETRARRQTRFREGVVWDAIRYMAYADDDETTFNTHPLVYIGADNKGLNQALEMPGPGNKDPHASYPFPGRYPNVGPGGTTDQVDHEVDIREHLRAVREGTADPGPVFEGGSVLTLADPGRLRILPDWERVVELARADARGRRDWAWMVLPIRWGYPATRSPFSGILANVNLGNVAPIGPSYNTAWNVTGAAPGYGYYEPHTLPDVLPIQVQDAFRNDLGFLNLTLPVLFNLPPLDFVTRLLAYPFRRLLGRQSTVYYPAESLPFRFVGISSGVSVQTLNEDFNAIAVNPTQFEPFITGLVLHLLDNGVDTETESSPSTRRTTAVGPFINVPFYLGEHFVSENTLRNVRSRISFAVEFTDTIPPIDVIPPFTYSGDFDLWEYAGSLQYRPFTGRLQPYAKGGYGWSWYRLENAQIGGDPLTPATLDWIGPKSIWPNVWHYGLGVELIARRGSGAGLAGLDLGVRLEYARYVQNLDLDLSSIPLENLRIAFPTLADVPSEGVARNDFVFALTVSF